MPTVFDNIETPFLDGEDGNGLKHALKLAKRGDFCVGYFNLRGWRCIDRVVNDWKIPDVVYATKAHIPHSEHPSQTPPGVLCYIRTPQDHDALIWIDSEGKTVTESLVRIFRQAKCTAETPALPRRADHHELVARSVKIV